MIRIIIDISEQDVSKGQIGGKIETSSYSNKPTPEETNIRDLIFTFIKNIGGAMGSTPGGSAFIKEIKYDHESETGTNQRNMRRS